jgi:hypothetical protein
MLNRKQSYSDSILLLIWQAATLYREKSERKYVRILKVTKYRAWGRRLK